MGTLSEAVRISFALDNPQVSATLNGTLNPRPVVLLHGRHDDAKVPVTTVRCIEYLRADRDGDVEIRDEAFEHLVAIMLTATKGLYIPEDIRTEGQDTAKYRFVRRFLRKTLQPWRGKTDDEIEAAASAGTFRHLGNRCLSRVKNQIRDLLRRRLRQVRYNDEMAEHQPVRRNPITADEFEDLISVCDFLPEREAETARALFELRDQKRTRWAAVLAKMRGVSVQTARKYIRKLREKYQAAIRDGRPEAQRLFGALSGNADD